LLEVSKEESPTVVSVENKSEHPDDIEEKSKID